MLFNSLSFLIFFPLVVWIYFAIPKTWQRAWLLLASCIFYMAFVPQYILILFFLITLDFYLGQAIARSVAKARKSLLLISVCSNLGLLFIFKYFNFFNHNLDSLANLLHWNYSPWLLTIVLPLGLSFHVFQSLSYVIEVYRGKYPPETNYLTYSLYVMFFPQLVAGPIERPSHLLPQLKLTYEFDAHLVRLGLERMLWGFFKKIVIADQIASIINPLFVNLPQDAPAAWSLLILFAIQLYCDFSGYSDIALGSAQVLGLNLSENFNRPYAARTVADFWRRWHISLSNWLRDYLYYPLALGWGKVSKLRLYFALFITFTLIGLWHGANWTFVILGALHGFYLVFALVTEKFRKRLVTKIGLDKYPKLYHTLQVMIVFVLVAFSWLFFRVQNLSQAWLLTKNLFHNFQLFFSVSYWHQDLLTGQALGTYANVLAVIVFMVLIMESVQFKQAQANSFYIFDRQSKWLRYLWYYFLIISIIFLSSGGEQNFIYFQF